MIKASLKLAILYLLGVFLIVSMLPSCGSYGPSGHTHDDEEPPRPPEYDFLDTEPNNTFETAQFISLLPDYEKRDIHGYISAPNGADVFYYYLNPVAGDDELLLNLDVAFFWANTPKVSLYQTKYNEMGFADGYQFLGTYVGQNGKLEVINAPIYYNFFTNNDLFIVLEAYGEGYDEYVLEYWTW